MDLCPTMCSSAPNREVSRYTLYPVPLLPYPYNLPTSSPSPASSLSFPASSVVSCFFSFLSCFSPPPPTSLSFLSSPSFPAFFSFFSCFHSFHNYFLLVLLPFSGISSCQCW